MATPMVLDPNPIPKPSLEVLATQTDASSQDVSGSWNSSRYIKDRLKSLRREHLQAQEELKRIQSVPLVIGQFMEMIDQNNSIVGSTTGSNYYVRILSTINRELLKPSVSEMSRRSVWRRFSSRKSHEAQPHHWDIPSLNVSAACWASSLSRLEQSSLKNLTS
nr:26S protease regulatory subunit 6B homolog [Ipomoea batatas]